MNNNKYFYFIFFAVLLFSVGCEKNPFAYRSKYVGDYDFVNSWSSYNMSLTPPTSSGTSYTSGKIEYGKKGMIQITFDNNNPAFFTELEIDRDGTLYFISGGTAGKCDSRKKMHYSYSSNGLGGGGTSYIIGTKK